MTFRTIKFFLMTSTKKFEIENGWTVLKQQRSKALTHRGSDPQGSNAVKCWGSDPQCGKVLKACKPKKVADQPPFINYSLFAPMNLGFQYELLMLAIDTPLEVAAWIIWPFPM